MLVGQSKHAIDGKNRVSIPARIRNAIDFTQGQFYIRYHEMGFLEVGKEEDFELLSDTFTKYAAPFHDIFKSPDQTGRVVIKDYLLNMIKTEEDSELIVFGRGKTFGICSTRNWPEIERSFKNKLDELKQKPE